MKTKPVLCNWGKRKTVKTVKGSGTRPHTQLKLGVNEIERVWRGFVLLPIIAALFVACSPNKSRTANQTSTPPTPSANPLSIVLAQEPGDARNAAKIADLQRRIRKGKQTALALEQLGWVFISEARTSFDPGYFKLAEQCGLALDALEPRSPESLLLRGYALQNLHQFKQAEPLARE